MDLTIRLDEPQTHLLRAHATAKGQSPEQAAQEIVESELAKRADDERWAPLNDRRVALIEKARQTGLAAEESAELDGLQAALDARLEAVDLRRIALMERAVARMQGVAP